MTVSPQAENIFLLLKPPAMCDGSPGTLPEEPVNINRHEWGRAAGGDTVTAGKE